MYTTIQGCEIFEKFNQSYFYSNEYADVFLKIEKCIFVYCRIKREGQASQSFTVFLNKDSFVNKKVNTNERNHLILKNAHDHSKVAWTMSIFYRY